MLFSNKLKIKVSHCRTIQNQCFSIQHEFQPIDKSNFAIQLFLHFSNYIEGSHKLLQFDGYSQIIQFFRIMSKRIQESLKSSSEYSQSEDVQALNLQLEAENLRSKQATRVQNFKIIFSKQYERKTFRTTLPATEHFFNRDVESEELLQSQGEQEKKNQLKNTIQKKQVITKQIRKVQLLATSINNKKKWSTCQKGTRFETRNLCKQLFTETASFLKMVAIIQDPSSEQKQAMRKFLDKKSKVSIESFKELFSCKQLKSKCLAFYRSNQLISKVMQSRADLKSKLTFLKYIQTIRNLPIDMNIIAWKK